MPSPPAFSTAWKDRPTSETSRLPGLALRDNQVPIRELPPSPRLRKEGLGMRGFRIGSKSTVRWGMCRLREADHPGDSSDVSRIETGCGRPTWGIFW